jgi:acetylornithine deacetylase/succinyl-diaminopimelate desuccinylase-like protein
MNDRLSPATLAHLDRLDAHALGTHVAESWRDRIVPELQQYIEIPAKSPMFAPDWAEQGHLKRVLQRAADWVLAQKVPGLTLEIIELTNELGKARTPVLFFEFPASSGTADVRPHGQAARVHRLAQRPGPWTPKYEDGKLYGRGGADDGYAVYASIASGAGAEGAEGGAPAHRGPDRNLRRIRQLRPAALHRRAAAPIAWATWRW